MTNYEFKIVSGTSSNVQKILNQWKHKYHLKIKDFKVENEVVYCFLIRTERSTK